MFSGGIEKDHEHVMSQILFLGICLDLQACHHLLCSLDFCLCRKVLGGWQKKVILAFKHGVI